MTATQSLSLTFTQPANPVSVNETSGKHWATVRRQTKPWGEHAYVRFLGAIRQGRWTPGRPITVRVTLAFRTARRRDAHNYTGTVVKAVVDGLVRAGVVPDDTVEWVTVEDPTFSIQRERPAPLVCTITITERTSP